jgi:hypothetical protein
VLAFSQEAATSLNRELLKEGSPLELNKAKKAVRVLAGLGDKLVEDAKSSRRAAALLRRAFMGVKILKSPTIASAGSNFDFGWKKILNFQKI